MSLTNVLLLSQIAGHIIGLIVSLCMIVPMSMHLHDFKGKCLLFSGGTWGTDDGYLNVTWASRVYCDYVIAIGVLTFIACSIQIYRLCMFMYKGVDSSFFSAFLEAVGCAVMCVLTVCTAIIMTLGFMSWCQVIVLRFSSCDACAGQRIDKRDEIQTSGFYIEMGAAQFGAWAAFATWVGLTVFSTLKVSRYHQRENIQVSMFRERQRLVNESGSPTTQDPTGRSTPPLEAGLQ